MIGTIDQLLSNHELMIAFGFYMAGVATKNGTKFAEEMTRRMLNIKGGKGDSSGGEDQ